MDYKDISAISHLDEYYPSHILDKFPVAPRNNRWKDTADEDWNSWHWQLKNRVTSISSLEELLDLGVDQKRAFHSLAEMMPCAITPYYLSLIDGNDAQCPIWLQSIPSVKELDIHEEDMEDPLAEDSDMPVTGITHRYPDRVLFYVSSDCPMLCRHCSRRRKVSGQDSNPKRRHIEAGLEYIEKHSEVRDVVVSGGDPLCLGTQKIDYILGRLRAMPHVEIIRIGTRSNVTNVFRYMDDELIAVLDRHAPIHINTHYNHPREMTREALLANTRLALAGITLGNQTVLLKGINNSAQVMKELAHKLLLMRIRPYYIYQCDLAEGITHFRTTIAEGIEIIEKMRGWTSGLAIPQYVIDAPGGGGKIPINPNYIEDKDGCKITLRNYQNNNYTYYEPEQ